MHEKNKFTKTICKRFFFQDGVSSPISAMLLCRLCWCWTESKIPIATQTNNICKTCRCFKQTIPVRTSASALEPSRHRGATCSDSAPGKRPIRWEVAAAPRVTPGGHNQLIISHIIIIMFKTLYNLTCLNSILFMSAHIFHVYKDSMLTKLIKIYLKPRKKW